VHSELTISTRNPASSQFCAGVRVDFAVQADFFKLRGCPLHDFPPSFDVCFFRS
jgi:hypothetical protein